MIKKSIFLIRKFAGRLEKISSWLERKDTATVTRAKFVDLAPTDDADKAGIYSEAILFATNNAKVSNIALTGPYGSGKSSIIQTFLRTYQRSALHISLAAFIPESDSQAMKVSRQEIERSILQQMLYGADSKRLPLSRFKRIQSPDAWSIGKSLFITLGILASCYIISRRVDVMSGAFFTPLELSNAFNLGVFAFSVIFLWVTLHHFYVASFGLSLKSISLKDVEIRPAHDDQTSILNRHLDEILYFFQSTDYDLVIIEDLDRFNDSEVFVTLREINSLINENAGVRRRIRFLYALRDDMFVNTDRTKFFEFIIPVIPIINSSNSIDMMLTQGKRLALDQRLDKQFIREVSRYLNDLRLIQNIFNEYVIYMANLDATDENLLSANKLLAVLIYKNVYPRDFEQLHRGSGSLALILNQQDRLVRNGEVTYKNEIEELENTIEIAERQVPSDLGELRKIYAMALVERLPPGTASVSVDHQGVSIEFNQIANHDEFERFIEAERLLVRHPNSGASWISSPNLQEAVDPQKTYRQRKEEIENKGADAKNRAFRRISDLRSKMSKLRTIKLNEILRLNPTQVDGLFSEFEENQGLARFLVLEGHLDDTYYQYTSLFHSGRLSPNDNRFLIQIRAFVAPEPDFPVDNPREVIAAMRHEDFRQRYVLNVKLVDCILSDQISYGQQVQRLIEFMSSEFESCEDFFESYYTSGLNVPKLLSGLSEAWKDFVPTVIASPVAIAHVTKIIENLSIESLTGLARDREELSDFVAANLPAILINLPKLAPERLECLCFDVKDFAAIGERTEIVSLMFKKGLYEITIGNLEYIYQEILGRGDLESMRMRNFTAIRLAGNSVLLKKIECNFSSYFKGILLKLPENVNEDIPAIQEILNHREIDQEDIRKFLEMQVARLPTLEGVPEELHATLFQFDAIEASWTNILAFIESGGFDADSLVRYLELDAVRKAILQHSMPGDPESLKLRQFLIAANALSDDAYSEYVHALPSQFKGLPKTLDSSKVGILISSQKISFSRENFDEISDDEELQVLFVADNIDVYFSDPSAFAIDDDFREKLLRSEIDLVAKFGIIELMDLEVLRGLPGRSALVGSIVVDIDIDISKFSSSAAQSVVIYSQPISTQISLFNKFQSLMSDDEVRHVLASLPSPFSEVKIGYGTPKIINTSENRDLVEWLDARDIISSWSEHRLFGDYVKINLYRS